MKHDVSAWVVGFVFALGLGISGMTDPQKVQGFLDVFGSWDPTLIFVMVGAIVIHFFSYKLIRKRKSPMFSPDWKLPKKSKIDRNLVLGSIIFGLGWGLAGYCPGPGVVSISSLSMNPLIFVLGMLGGMALFRVLDQKFGIGR